MPAPEPLVEAVQAAILAAAHATAFERLSGAREACERLGTLAGDRWSGAARDLRQLEDALEAAVDEATDDLTERASVLGVPEEALWTVGDAAALLDGLRDDALEELEDGSSAARLLEGDLLLGAALLEDADAADRGRTLLFGWPEPLLPAVWPWETTWVAESDEDAGEQELELFGVGELEVGDELSQAAMRQLGVDRGAALAALEQVAVAVTRASLRAAAEELDDDEDADSSENGHLG